MRILARFYIDFDHYYTTHSPENQQLTHLIYQRLQQRGDITTRMVQQAYDPIKKMFLPDRYVKGECPRCGAKNQYGDNCEVCGATYSPTELRNPISILSGEPPVQKESLHYFFSLGKYTEMLQNFTQAGHLQEQVANKLLEWFQAGLQAWDISRDAPYFGFEIPGAPGKYFYVWLDAPIGYIANFENFCSLNPQYQFDEYWQQDSPVELYHFIGKDVVYFHALFWPAILESSQLRKPSAIFVHGFLTVNGQKMSKSRGTFITAQEYLAHLDPEYLRYYFAAKLNSRVDDIDFNSLDFVQRINADLVGKVVNIASRSAGFISKLFAGNLADELAEPALFQEFVQAGDRIAAFYAGRDYHLAVREIMALADRANQYIDSVKPWVLAKQPDQLPQLQKILSLNLNLFKILMTYLKPILPKTALASEEFLNIPAMDWMSRGIPLLKHSIRPFQPLLQRVEAQVVMQLIKSSEDFTSLQPGSRHPAGTTGDLP